MPLKIHTVSSLPLIFIYLMYISPENILRDACTMSLPVFLITKRDQKETGSSEIQYLNEDFFLVVFTMFTVFLSYFFPSKLTIQCSGQLFVHIN